MMEGVQIRLALRELKEMYEEGLLDEEAFREERVHLMEQWRAAALESGEAVGSGDETEFDALLDAEGGLEKEAEEGSQKALEGGAEKVVDQFLTGAQEPQLGADLYETGAVEESALLGEESEEVVLEGWEGQVLLERYRVERLLGRGGMGQVYYAYDQELGEGCAVKLIDPGLAGDAQLRERFVRELKFIRELSHPGIVRAHALHRDDVRGVLFFTMEYIEGETLAEALLREGEKVPLFGVKGLRSLFRALAEVVDYAHGQGVIHRDLKPANVMLLEGSQVKLLDFGIARVLTETHVTQHTGLVGTMYYMAPEQLEGGEVTPATDVFSLGVLLYQMLTGKLPVGHVEPPSAYVKELPAAVDEVVLKAMAARVDARFADVSALLDAFEKAWDGAARSGAQALGDASSGERVLGKEERKKKKRTAKEKKRGREKRRLKELVASLEEKMRDGAVEDAYEAWVQARVESSFGELYDGDPFKQRLEEAYEAHKKDLDQFLEGVQAVRKEEGPAEALRLLRRHVVDARRWREAEEALEQEDRSFAKLLEQYPQWEGEKLAVLEEILAEDEAVKALADRLWPQLKERPFEEIETQWQTRQEESKYGALYAGHAFAHKLETQREKLALTLELMRENIEEKGPEEGLQMLEQLRSMHHPPPSKALAALETDLRWDVLQWNKKRGALENPENPDFRDEEWAQLHRQMRVSQDFFARLDETHKKAEQERKDELIWEERAKEEKETVFRVYGCIAFVGLVFVALLLWWWSLS